MTLYDNAYLGVPNMLTHIADEHVQQTEKILSEIDCPRAGKCFNSSFGPMPQSEIIGDGRLVECFATDQEQCKFALFVDDGSFCKCPVRNYVARNLQL